MPRSLEEERQVKFPTSPVPPPLLVVIAKYVHCAACTCRIQQAKKVWDEKFAMNGSLRFQVLDTLHPPPFHNPVSKFCLLKTNVRFPAHTDKHSQIYRILLPICNALSQLPTLYNWLALRTYIDVEYGLLDGLYLAILSNFFQLCPPHFHNPVLKLCPLKTNVRSSCTQTNTHRSTASSCPSATYFPSCRVRLSADAVQPAHAARVHRCGVWLARQALPCHPQRLFPACIRQDRCG